MKKQFFLLSTAIIFLLTSCLDTEEKIEMNENGSGNYSIAMDMSKMIGLLKQMGGGNEASEKKDTVIYFKSFTDTARNLSVMEKELLKDGRLLVKIDLDNEQMKIVINTPFTKISQLSYLKENLSQMLDKIKVVDQAASQNLLGENNSQPASDVKSPKTQANPVADLYKFSLTDKQVSYKLINKQAALDFISKDSNIQGLKEMKLVVGEVQYKTVLVFPHAVNKVVAVNYKLSDDKKTVTIFSSLSELLEKPELLEYEVNY
ncbi:MAG TPA: hypothetical protein VFN30_01250 [Chitinophagaceae bacterium]|nr:hypothetical protein [Chitinophagaceae bacterium]